MNIKQVYDSFSDSLNCNMKEMEVIKCYNELDKKIFFKKKKNKKCQELDEIFKHCLVYSNQNKLYKREEYRPEDKEAEILQKHLEAKIESKKNSLDYLSGKITEDDLKNKQSKNTKLIEL